ncbi:hypothetical protein [Streptomyces beigongshangae]|uniref:hypothetical protein n=1 Tax=Streptomyces beigongshangae TaxID=2841597 RepID=UPI001C856791|nr:hypothetical protein [Streptomyces sp. REN17]
MPASVPFAPLPTPIPHEVGRRQLLRGLTAGFGGQAATKPPPHKESAWQHR